jgi:hypothetical protein
MIRPVVLRIVATSALLAVTLGGCQRGTTEADGAALGAFADEPFFLRGSIREIGVWGYVIHGEPGTSYRTDRAAFRVFDDTEFRRADGSPASAADLAVGRTIKLWITGIIMESYPVQVHAKAIVIE